MVPVITVLDDVLNWHVHMNNGQRIEIKHRMEIKTHGDLKRKFLEASSGKSSLESMIENHVHKLEEAHAGLHEMVDDARLYLTTLQEIALKPNPLTQVEYIQLLINSEKKQANEGWFERVKYLDTAMKQAKLLSVMQDMNAIDQRIEKEKEKREEGWEESVETLEQVKRIKSAVEKARKSKSILQTIKDIPKAFRKEKTQ